ncbi:MAG: PAS domain S-box protein, partial [Nitrospinota bacterium]|nr:PAS domain S-box protein [Nitrospinota bacterium]
TRQRSYESALLESEEKYRTLISQMKEGVAVIQDEKVVLANEAMASMFGYDLDEITGINIEKLLSPSVIEGIAKQHREMLAGKEAPTSYETTIRKKDGTEVEVSVSAGLISFEGHPAVLNSVRAITDSKRVEEKLRTQAAIMKNVAEGVQMIRMSDSVIVHANPKFEQMFGYDHGELIGKHVAIQNMPTEQTPLDISSHINSILKKKGEWSGEICNVKKDGTPFWAHTTVTRYRDPEHGEVMLAVKRDVTETKLAREALKESEERFRMFFENSPDAMLLADADTGMLLEANQAAEKLFGRPRKEFSGMSQSRLHPPEDTQVVKERFENRVTDPDPTIPRENMIVRADGTTAPVEVTGQRYMIEGKKVILGVFRDLTERKKAEEALRDSEERYRALVESSDDCICLLDLQGKFLFMNQCGMELNGYKSLEDVTGRNCLELLGDEFRPVMEGSLKKVGRGEACHVRYMTRTEGEDEMWWESILNPIRGHEGEVTAVLRISRDITEQIKAEEELFRNQEILEAISQAQSRFILGEQAERMFEGLLKRITSLSQSEFGFIGEARYDEAGKPYLKVHSISIMSGDKKAKRYMNKGFKPGMEFRKLDSLYGAVLDTAEYVISNNPAADPRSSGLPNGHPALNCFFGVPLKRGDTLVGMIGLANRPGGYEESMKDFLEPFITTCSSMIEASRADSRRLAAEKAVRDSE